MVNDKITLIEHELDLSQSDKAGFQRTNYGVTLKTWSLTREQAHWMYQKITGLIEEAERRKPDDF